MTDQPKPATPAQEQPAFPPGSPFHPYPHGAYPSPFHPAGAPAGAPYPHHFIIPPPPDGTPHEGGQPGVPPGPYVVAIAPPGVPGVTGVVYYPPQAQPFAPPVAQAQAGQRPKRKQVKMACTNCATACKRCDDTRPCERCVKYGIADTCIDGQRKERKKGIKRGPYKRKNKDAPEPQAFPGTSAAAPIHPAPQFPPEGYFPVYYPPGAFLPHPPDASQPGAEGSQPQPHPTGQHVVPYYIHPGPYPPFYPGLYPPPPPGAPVIAGAPGHHPLPPAAIPVAAVQPQPPTQAAPTTTSMSPADATLAVKKLSEEAAVSPAAVASASATATNTGSGEGSALSASSTAPPAPSASVPASTSASTQPPPPSTATPVTGSDDAMAVDATSNTPLRQKRARASKDKVESGKKKQKTSTATTTSAAAAVIVSAPPPPVIAAVGQEEKKENKELEVGATTGQENPTPAITNGVGGADDSDTA